MFITQHDGEWVALLATYTYRDSVTDCEVAVIGVSLALIENWRGKLALAKRLTAEHDLAQIAWWDYSPMFYAGNHEEEELDDSLPAPQWTEEARVDALQLHATDDSLWWEGSHHYADVPVGTERLTAADLDTMAEALAAEKEAP